ncbi:MAG TPA: 6-phosphogluconolactonase [Thermoanaerobaculia bacterium]
MRELPPEGPPSFEVRVLPDASGAAEAAARELFAAAQHALADHGLFRVALSGGSTPGALFDRLGRPPFRRRIDWKRTRIFFMDERCVPPRHKRSNYRLVKERLIDPLRLPAENVFRMRGEEDPPRAAREYEEILRREFGARRAPAEFDLVLLGLGTDGHTASLFAGTRAVGEKRRWVVANWIPKLSEWRLTLTLPVVNAARSAIFLVTGSEKATVVSTVLRMKRGVSTLPASLVRPRRGSLIWILDEAAAAGSH